MVKFFDWGPELYFKKDQMLYHNPLNMMTAELVSFKVF